MFIKMNMADRIYDENNSFGLNKNLEINLSNQ